MPVSAGALAGIAAGATALSGGIQYATSMKSLRKNKKLAEYQHNLNMQAWREQAAYNSPEQQMQRLKDAGLNPNLVYGQGSGTTGQADPPPQFNAPTADLRVNPDFSGAVSTLLNAEMTRGQLRHIDEQIKTQEQARLESMARVSKMAQEMEQMSFDLGFKREAREYNMNFLKLQNNKLTADIEESASRKALNDANSQLSRNNAAFVKEQMDRFVKMTPKELENADLRNALFKVDKTVKEWEIKEIGARIGHIAQQIAEGKVAQAYKAADAAMKQYDALRLFVGSHYDGRITNPLMQMMNAIHGLWTDRRVGSGMDPRNPVSAFTLHRWMQQNTPGYDNPK